MDLRARLYYMDLYARPPRRSVADRYPSKAVDVDEAHLADAIREVIARVEEDIRGRGGAPLREDARALLLLNGQFMIAQPILETGRQSETEMMKDLEADIRAILSPYAPAEQPEDAAGPNIPQDSPARYPESEEGAVSGSDVIERLNEERSRLRTHRFAVWNT